MKHIKYLADCFLTLDPTEKVDVVSVTEQTYFYTVRLQNVAPTTNTQSGVQKYFGNLPVRITPVPNSNCVDIDVSKVKLPHGLYDVRRFARPIESKLKSEYPNHWFLGLTDFGPHYFDLNRLTHIGLYGASGFGKSSLFRLLLAQTLRYVPNTVNFIIDPKKIDYSSYEKHSAVRAIAKSYAEWSSVVTSLVTECAFREKVFSQAFDSAPTCLQEYTALREKFSRHDLPEFKRTLLWIDEAHVLFQDVSDMPCYSGLVYLARKARSFGIHLVISSQRASDIPSAIRTQLSQSFSFFTTDNHILNDFGFNPEKMSAIVGRLYYVDTETRQSHAIQCPYVNNDDAVGLAYLNHQPQAAYGVSRLKIAREWLDNGHIVNYLNTGATLDAAARLPVEKIKDYKNYKKSHEFSFHYPHWYEQAETDSALISPQSAAVTAAPEATTDELMAEFERILNGHTALADKKPAVPAPPKPAVPVASRQTEIPDYNRTHNFADQASLTAKIDKIMGFAEKNFNWCLKDISANPGLLAAQRVLKGLFDQRLYIHSIRDLALGEKQERLFNSYLDLAQKSLESKTKAPLLVLSGKESTGKQTIIESAFQYLRIPVQQGQLRDVLHIPHNSFEAQRYAHAKSAEPKAFVFENPQEALEFYNHCGVNDFVVVSYTEPKENFFDLFSGMQATFDFAYVKENHLLVRVDESMYSEPALFEKLILAILIKHEYIGSVVGLGKLFASSRVRALPAQIEAVINRASTRAKYAKVDFDETILKETLSFLELSSQLQPKDVQIVHAQKTLADLVLHPETEKDLSDVIHRARHLDSSRFEFSKRLRKNPRMVALFSGEPGTGKTLAAEVIASEVNKDLWVCDFSKILGSYLGETERTLTRIFNAARVAGCVLLLDECDALLGSRTEAARGERAVINHLLMLIENFNGVLILTTNFTDHLDVAFSRRFDVKTNFKFPTEEQMAEILTRLLQPDAPLELDFDALNVVRGFRLSGGLIRNAVERAIIFMERNQSPVLTESMLRQAVEDIYNENLLVAKQEKRVGIAS